MRSFNRRSQVKTIFQHLNDVLMVLFLFLLVLEPSNCGPNQDIEISFNPMPNPCTQIFGRYCIQCSNNTCTKCQSQNFTLVPKKNQQLPFQACICSSPYIFNLTFNISTTYATQYLLYSQTNPCVLCMDKYSLDQCQPSLFRHNVTHNVNTNTSVLMLAFNRYSQTMRQLNNIANLFKNGLIIKYEIDDTQINIINASDGNCTISVPTQRLSAESYFLDYQTASFSAYCLNLTTYHLPSIGYQHYSNNNLQMPKPVGNVSFFRIKIYKKNPKVPIAQVNGTGFPLPQSYRSQIMFKSIYTQNIGGYQPDDLFYGWDYSGTQSIIFQIPMYPLINNVSNTNSTNNTNTGTNLINTNTSTNTNTSSSNSSSQSPAYSVQQQNSTENSSNLQYVNIFQNNYGIFHNFTDTEQTVKLGIQAALIGLSSSGLLGVGASSFLTSVMSFTHVFGDMGLYSEQANMYQQQQLNTTTANSSRLLLFEDLPNITIQITTSYFKSFKDLADCTLTLNPLILSQPIGNTIIIGGSLPTFSLSLFYTVLMMLAVVPILLVFLCYINRYSRNKREYQYSHILFTLSQKNMIKRTIYMAVRGLYPLLAYVILVFISNLYDAGVNSLNNIYWDLWSILYFVQMSITAVLVIGLPIFGVCYFNSLDKNNLYIFWRMYGYQAPSVKQQQKQQQNQQQQQQQNINESEHKIKQASQQQQQSKHEINKINEDSDQNSNKQQIIVPANLPQISSKSFKVFSRSRLPILYFVFDYIYIVSFLALSIFVSAAKFQLLQNCLLISLCALMNVFTLYCYITVGVSKAYGVVKIVQGFIVLAFLICRIFWYQSILFAYFALFLIYGIGGWAVFSVLFNIVTMMYWESKGLGIYAFFLNKIVPIQSQQPSCSNMESQNKDKDNQMKDQNVKEAPKNENILKNSNKQVKIQQNHKKQKNTESKPKKNENKPQLKITKPRQHK